MQNNNTKPARVPSKAKISRAPTATSVFDASMQKINARLCSRLEKAAKDASKRAYAPYSKFRVGAAILTGSGKVYSGCNVENASYGLCNCAERTAIFSAIAAGEKTVEAVVVYTPTKTATSPCGACRQVINEFGPQVPVVSICASKDRIETTLDALLPEAFGPKNLL